MEVKQIYALMNNVTSEVLGDSVVVNEDLSNIVDVGNAVFGANAVDNYVKSLVNHIGKVVFVNRPYTGKIKSVLMDGWEFGSVMQKISVDLPNATENESWDLQNGESYDPNVFYKPTVDAKFFNKRITFEVPMSFTEKQVKESFSNVAQLNGFLSMLYNAVDKSLTIKVEALVMRTINNMIGETIGSDYGTETADYTTKSGVKAVNLLHLYKEKNSNTTLTAENCITDTDFIKFASYYMGVYSERMGSISKLFNIGGKDRFTPQDMLHVVLLADFSSSADTYLQSSTFHNEFTALPKAEVVPYWQGSGTGYAFEDISSINVKTASGKTINVSGILGVMFDHDALGVCNVDRRTTTAYNPKAEFFTNWAKYDAEYFNDMNENFVVFFVA